MNTTMTCAIILAAGKSRRMNQPKLLLPWGEKTIIAHVADEVFGAACIEHVVVVVGDNSAAIARALKGRTVHVAVNPDPDGDMLSSIRCGLRASPAHCAAYAIVLGDQPTLRAQWIDAMAAALASSGKGLVVPFCQGRRGHPILFAGRYRDPVLHGYDGVGLRGLLHEHADDVLEVPFEDAGVLCDLDTPEDYARALEQIHRLGS
ncbi:MAG: nucleotidyltransferase family protein [Candidatus Sumerlaeia bacterium]|nr:nucleotidyltransferase family protein [Candidatus Sumerlaeia bacterium]